MSSVNKLFILRCPDDKNLVARTCIPFPGIVLFKITYFNLYIML